VIYRTYFSFFPSTVHACECHPFDFMPIITSFLKCAIYDFLITRMSVSCPLPSSQSQYTQHPLLIRPQSTFFSGGYKTNFAPIKSSVQIEDSVLNIFDRIWEDEMSNMQFHRILITSFSLADVHTVFGEEA